MSPTLTEMWCDNDNGQWQWKISGSRFEPYLKIPTLPVEHYTVLCIYETIKRELNIVVDFVLFWWFYSSIIKKRREPGKKCHAKTTYVLMMILLRAIKKARADKKCHAISVMRVFLISFLKKIQRQRIQHGPPIGSLHAWKRQAEGSWPVGRGARRPVMFLAAAVGQIFNSVSPRSSPRRSEEPSSQPDVALSTR
jgi:hypothetical protein